MKQASFQIGDSLNKEKNNVSEYEYIANVKKEVNLKKEVNKNIITNDTKTHNKPKKLVENIYYF
jgi:hypothetical protein